MNEKVLDILTHGMIIVLKTEIDELSLFVSLRHHSQKGAGGELNPRPLVP